MSGSARATAPLVSASQDTAETLPIVIVGNGPAGMRAAREILDRLPDQAVVIYGDEPYEAYNRVRLSSWLAGEVGWQELAQPLGAAGHSRAEERIGYRVTAIDREQRCVVDSTGRVQPYRKLILSTGSKPFMPHIAGIELDGVYTFRDLDDTNRLIARQARSHHTVVIGGGLLGLEAARGMQRGGTTVTVLEHADRLLGRQLDETASARLQETVEALGIEVIVGDAVTQIGGRGRVEQLTLRSGLILRCDTLVVAAGIRPNIALARDAGLAFGRGIQVDDQMRSSDPDIYAIGECAEHRGQVYGLVAPALEHAAVAAADLAGIDSHYPGSVAASRLKVVGTQVFSMGPMGAGEHPGYGSAYTYAEPPAGVYRKILVRRHRLIGAIGIGDWNETVRLQTMIGRSERIWPWQILRFVRSGQIWPAQESEGVAAWPAGAIVCQCTGVTRGSISEAIACGACDAEAVTRATGASSVCGSCKPLLSNLLGNQQPVEPAPLHRSLLVSAVVALLASLAIFLAPAIPYPDSVQVTWRWDELWRDSLIKQVTGFTVLGLFAIGLLVSPRKRMRKLQKAGSFDAWRLAHVLLGVLAIIGLFVHTGLRMGHGLNLALMTTFGLMLLAGTLTTAVIAWGHRLDMALVQRLRRQSLWLHLLLFWPVPVLLAWHVTKTYWY